MAISSHEWFRTLGIDGHALAPGEGMRLQQVVDARAALILRQLVMSYNGDTLTHERAYAGIAAIAALRSVITDLAEPTTLKKG